MTRKQRMPRAGIAGACCALVLASLTMGCAGAGTAGAPTPPVLHGVLDASLAAAGVQLAPASAQDAASATGTVDGVRAVSLARDPGARILDAALVHYAELDSQPPFTCLCWVVAAEPSNGIFVSGPVRIGPDGAPLPATVLVPDNPIHLDVYDASGKFLWSAEGATGLHPR